MGFSANHPILFLLVGIIIAVVLGESLYFLIKAWRRAVEKRMDTSIIKKTVITSAMFTVAPAISIVITVLTLSKSLGVALPWLRLSVVGSLSYEAVAAANAASGMGMTLAELADNMNASAFVTVTIVMTLSIMVGIWLVPVISKKLQNGLISYEKKDKRWAGILQSALFVGMISAFVGFIFSDVSRLWLSDGGVFTDKDGNVFSSTSGLIPVFVMTVSAVLMCLFGIVSRKTKWRFISDFALSLCMILGMAFAIPITAWLGG